MRKRCINIAKIITNAIKKGVKSYLNMINPVNIVKSYVKEYKENRLCYNLVFAGIIFLLICKFGLMEADISPLIKKVSDAQLVGGDDIPAQLKIETSTGIFLLIGGGLYGFMRPIGISFCVMYWLIMVINASVRDDFSPEQVAILMIKLFVPVIIIDHGYTLMSEICKVGNAVLDDLSSTLTINTLNDPHAEVEMEVPLAKYLSVLIPAYLLWGVGVVGRVCALMAIYARRIRLALIIGMSPFGLADFSGEEHSQSIRLMKEVLAIALHGAVILAINYAGYKLLRQELGAGSGTIVQEMVAHDFNLFQLVGAFAVSITAIGMYAKSTEISKSIVGL